MLQQYDDATVMTHLEETFNLLREKLLPTGKGNASGSRKKGFFRTTSGGPEVINTADVIKDEQISAIVNLERRLYNFIAQWIQLRAHMHTSQAPPLAQQFAPVLKFAYHCGPERVTALKALLDELAPAPSGVRFAVDEPEAEAPIVISESTIPLAAQKADVLVEQMTIFEVEFYKEVRESAVENARLTRDIVEAQ